MTLKQLIREIKGDIGEKATAKRFLKVYFFSPGFRVLFNHRVGKYFYKSNNFLLRHLSLYYRYKMITKRSCDISYDASIGKGLQLPHPIGIVIGEGVIIEDNVKIFQQVTLGSHGKIGLEQVYPMIKQNTKIYAGAKIIGGITVGENSIIGANSLVNKDVPGNSTAYGIPCKIKIVE